MNLNKLLLAGLSVMCLTACNDDDDLQIDNIPTVCKGLYVLNQGNMDSNIPGSITSIDPENNVVVQNAFYKANGRLIGDSPQAGITYGSKMYIGVHGSGTLEIMDKETLVSEKNLSLTGTYAGPRSLAAKDGKVYISLYDGYVARLDTLTMTVDKKCKVGPNPDEIVILGDYLYVTNSDGMNYNNDYANGYSVSKINLSTFTEDCKIPVGMNPTKIATDGNDVFVISMGDYTAENPSILQRLNINYDATDENSKGAEDLYEATLMAINGNRIYCINAPFYAPSFDCYIYNTSDKTKTAVDFRDLVNPQTIGVDPASGHVFISAATGGYSDPCKIMEYTSAGTLVNSYESGVYSAAFVF